MERAEDILKKHMEALHKMASYLLERETLNADEIELVLKGVELPPVKISKESNIEKGETVEQEQENDKPKTD